MRNKDGSTINSYFNKEGSTSNDTIYKQGQQLMLGQIEKVHFIDDQSNSSKKEVEYDVSVRDELGGQIVYKNVRVRSLHSGTNDYEETILEFNQFASQGDLSTGTAFGNKNGAIVIVAHFNDNKDRPFIIGTLMHPKKLGAKRADGIRKLGEFRGVEWNINQDGELIITQRGPRSANGKLKINDIVNTVIKLDKLGNVSISDKELNKIYLDRENKKINLSQTDGSTLVNSVEMDRTKPSVTVNVGNKGLKTTLDGSADTATIETKGGLKETLNGSSDKATMQTASGLVVEYDGAADKVSYTTAGGPSVTVFGSGSIIVSAGGATMTVDGNSGLISISGQLVDVGAAASALAVLGPQLIAWLSTHTHMGDGGPVPGPTSPPLVPPPASLLSTSVKIKE